MFEAAEMIVDPWNQQLIYLIQSITHHRPDGRFLYRNSDSMGTIDRNSLRAHRFRTIITSLFDTICI